MRLLLQSPPLHGATRTLIERTSRDHALKITSCSTVATCSGRRLGVQPEARSICSARRCAVVQIKHLCTAPGEQSALTSNPCHMNTRRPRKQCFDQATRRTRATSSQACADIIVTLSTRSLPRSPAGKHLLEIDPNHESSIHPSE
jgi:hypothetical protein